MFALDVIQPHPTWDIIDSTKLTTYMQCPRKFFYQYVLGWKSAYPNNHLVFGSAWHMAMEWLLNHPGDIGGANLAFLKYYREHFPLDTDDLFTPKTPQNAVDSISAYNDRFEREAEREEMLYTEVGGLVLVSEDHTMVFKCDAILRDKATGSIYGRDFKTSERKYRNWGDHYTMSMQMLTYLHALHCLYSDQDNLRMVVRGAWFYKKSPTEFADHTIDKTLDQMGAWLERVNTWIERLKIDMELLTYETTDGMPMAAFPQNDTACFNFGQQCAFFDFCNAWASPLARCEQVPIGFKQEYWNPLERPEIRTKINLATQSGQPVEIQE